MGNEGKKERLSPVVQGDRSGDQVTTAVSEEDFRDRDNAMLADSRGCLGRRRRILS
jgi:hypothetical protein